MTDCGNSKIPLSFNKTYLVYCILLGDEHELDRKLRSNENRYANAVFEDDTYDGYGGFLKLSVPKSVIKKESTASFVVYYLQHVYSEAGHVGTVDIRAVCR